MERFAPVFLGMNAVVWGPFTLALLLVTGGILSVSTHFFALTHFRTMLRQVFCVLHHQGGAQKGVSPFQALCTALAGTMGVGNITGVATALLLGGPGAVFWMWVSALLGMSTKYAEVVLAVRFRVHAQDGSYRGGPMYYLSRGLRQPALARIFCVLCVAASFGIGNLAQSNAVSNSLYESFGMPLWLSGLGACMLVGLVVVGGLKRICTVTEHTVPLMSALYIFFALFLLFCNRAAVPKALCEIVHCAFSPRAAFAGGGGYTMASAMRYGFARGVFSNEAGLGSAPIAHAAAQTESPVLQGLWGVFEVFADTFVCCTLTALVLLTSGVLGKGSSAGALTAQAFCGGLGAFGGAFVSVALVFFALSSMLGWCYYGEMSLSFLTHDSRPWRSVYRVLFLLTILVGATTRLETVWSLSDALNGLMILPNLIGVLGLSGVVSMLTRSFCRQEKSAHQRV